MEKAAGHHPGLVMLSTANEAPKQSLEINQKWVLVSKDRFSFKAREWMFLEWMELCQTL